jgi:hypothetical protein
MKPQILFEDSTRINAETSMLKKASAELNQLNNFMQEHKLGPLSHDLVNRFRRNPQEAVKDLYMARIPEVNEYTGLKNRKAEMLEQMQLPVAPREFPACGMAEEALHVFDYGDTVTINAERLEQHLNRHRFITDDPKLIQAHKDFTELGKKLNEINDRLNFIARPPVGIRTDYKLGEIIAITASGFTILQQGFAIATGMIRR